MKTYKSMLLLTVITLLAMSPVVSYAQYTMLVHKTDGDIIRLSIADVDSVTFDYSSIQTVTHEYIDLGLSVMWATCNVGASSPLMSGDYYAWGEKETHYVGDFQSGGVEWKEGKTGYNWTSYYYRIAESEWNTVTVSKYNSDASRGNVDNKTTLDMGDDVAYVKWGGDWRMPSYEEFEELIKSCTWIRSNHNGIDGYTVRSNLNGDSIFFPYSGEFIWDINVPDKATEVMCWTRTVGKAGTGHAYYMTTDNGKASMAYNQRCFGLTVRPVFVSDKYDSTKVAYIELGNAELQLNTGASERISCYTYSSLGNSLTADVNWSSTDPSVATVSNDGTVTAVKAGTCKVVASIGSISRMCDVIVTTQVLPSSTSGSNNGYGYVDLGLSVKWAICNIGADNPEDYGDYFAWGETEPYYADSYSQSNNPVWKDGKSNGYSWSSYKYANGSSGALTKYCTDSSKGYNGFVDNKTVLDLEDDAAHVNWGGNWRMPTQEEMEELRGKCSWSWTTLNGVVGYLVTSQVAGYENSSIFFPAAGSRSGTYLSGVGTKGEYWSNTFGRYYSDESIYGCNFEMSSGFSYSHSNYGTIRYYGMSIRPVCVKRLEQLYDLTLSESSLQLHVGGTRELLADTSGIGPVELAWSSTNDSVATVRGGVVTAIGAGTCEIILTAGDHQGICDVTVYENTDHEYVDLGLSVLWATCNVGASSPEGYGDYYSWGELEPKSSYYNNTYKFITGAQQHSGGTYTKYCNGDGKTVLEPEDDVAQIKWGGGWRIPSPDECSELLNNCTWTWTTVNGINGYRIVSKINGNEIFLPAAGEKWYDYATASSHGSSGSYHTNQLYSYESSSKYLYFSSSHDERVTYGSRYPGSSVRPVISPSDTVKQVGPPANEIWYTSTDGAVVVPNDAGVFGATLLSNTYQNGKGVMAFDGFVTQVGRDAFNGCSKLVTVDLPSGVAEIGWCAFRGCSNLSSIYIPDGVSTIFVGAFMECTSLTSITFPDAVRSLNNQVFYDCTNLSSIHFSDSITYIAHWVFENTPISSIVIPATVSQIDWGSIAGCRNLTSVSVDPRNTYYDSRGNCNAIIRTATNTLISGCAITVIPQDVTALYDYAFISCTGLDTITIPEGVTTIGRQVFQGCSNLSSITLPSTVQTMGEGVFNACQRLSYVKVLATVPPTIGETVFSTYNNCPIYVPAESLQAYKSAENWSVYADRIQAIP